MHSNNTQASLLPLRRLIALCAAVIVAAVALSLVSTTSTAVGATKTISCGKHITVYFVIYQYWGDPGARTTAIKPNGCWNYELINQNANRGDYSWSICHWPLPESDLGFLQGWGSKKVFDDTNPGSTDSVSNETGAVDFCGLSLGMGPVHTEFMANRNETDSWCSTNFNRGRCWRRNAGDPGLVTVSRYGAELYSSDDTADNLWNMWVETGYGASPSNSYPVINIRPNIAAKRGGGGYLYGEVNTDCIKNPKNVLYIYSGPRKNYPGTEIVDPTTVISQADVEIVDLALNYCTAAFTGGGMVLN